MIDPEKLIKSLISSKGKKKKSSGLGGLVNSKTLLLGLGAAGAAYMAHRHFVAKEGPPPAGGPPPSTPTAPLPPPPMASLGPAPSAAPALPPPPVAPTPPAPIPAAQAPANPSVFLVRAMIAAANADHEIDSEEKRRILAKCEVFALDPDERALLEQELEHPMGLRDVIATARQLNVPPRQVYAASFLAIEADTAAERAYLRKLAEGLALAETEAQELEAALG